MREANDTKDCLSVFIFEIEKSHLSMTYKIPSKKIAPINTGNTYVKYGRIHDLTFKPFPSLASFVKLSQPQALDCVQKIK